MKAEIRILHEGKAFRSKNGDFLSEVVVLIKLGKYEQVQHHFVIVAKGSGAETAPPKGAG